ncbi:hypothetical protein Pcac1_g24924 [Phytophthora cactorum]|nr:hypothetical protein Pcac1_g24924 [Phytophthora cactorum]KAG2966767.1 hypothetical protein PC119_g24653 [Phytophthora cactorum]
MRPHLRRKSTTDDSDDDDGVPLLREQRKVAPELGELSDVDFAAVTVQLRSVPDKRKSGTSPAKIIPDQVIR